MDLSAEQQQALDRALHIHGSGNLADAEKLYRQLLDEDPGQADALHYLGVIHLQTGRIEEAVSLIRSSIDARPDYLDAMVNLGFGLNSMGRFEEAVTQFESVLNAGLVTAPVLANLGGALAHLGRYGQAVARFEEALKLQPELAETRRSLADVLLRLGRTDDALREIRKALATGEPTLPMQVSLGNILFAAGQFDEAIECFEQVLALQPEFVQGHYRLGVLFRDLGEKDKALASFREAVARDSSFARAWHGIASVSVASVTEDDVGKMLALQEQPGTSEDDRMRLAFALGRHFENAGNYEAAAAQFLMANSLRRSGVKYDIDNDLLAMKNLRGCFDQSFLAAWSESGLPDRTPIFIVGMPRSGTTLVEQILASHPDVFAAGELPLLVDSIVATFPIRNGVDYTSSLADATQDDFRAAARRYLDGLPGKTARRVIDKLPHNFLNVGMIRILFPNATIVHCRRDARDTCFSIFKHLFGSDSHAYAYDLEELAHYYNGYAKLMNHWEQVMPGHLHTVHYEWMIENQEQTTRELLEACGLEWDPACLEFHKLERLVATLSASQVRQPIYRGSVGAWKPYEKLLAPLLEILEE